MIDVGSAARSGLRRTRAWLVVALALAVACPSVRAAADSDAGMRRPPAGDGLVLRPGLWVAGDLTLLGEVPEVDAARAEVDDASLLVRYEPASRLAFFGEVRLEELIEVVEGPGVEASDGEAMVERLYAEALLTPSLTVRLGKVFTPFGLWNVIHRAPLTWTVEEPAIVDDVFPTHATGLSLLYQTTWHGWSFDATTYGPAQDELKFRRSEEDGWLAGARVAAGRNVGRAFASLGLNAAGFRPYDRRDWVTATGLDLDVGVAGHQLTGEWTFRVPDRGGRTLHGFYLQDVVPLEPFLPVARNLYGVVRVEQFQPERGASAVGGLVGVFWRPHPNVILKLDYLSGTRSLENFSPGLHTSVSVLF